MKFQEKFINEPVYFSNNLVAVVEDNSNKEIQIYKKEIKSGQIYYSKYFTWYTPNEIVYISALNEEDLLIVYDDGNKKISIVHVKENKNIDEVYVLNEKESFYLIIDSFYNITLINIETDEYYINDVNKLNDLLLSLPFNVSTDINDYLHMNSNILNNKLFYPNEVISNQNIKIKNKKLWNFFNRPQIEHKFNTLFNTLEYYDNLRTRIVDYLSLKQKELTKQLFKEKIGWGIFNIFSFLLFVIISAYFTDTFYLILDVIKGKINVNNNILLKIGKPIGIALMLNILFNIFFIQKLNSKRKLNSIKNNLKLIQRIFDRNNLLEIYKNLDKVYKELENNINIFNDESIFISYIKDKIYSEEMKKIALLECGLETFDIIYKNNEPIIMYDISFIQDKTTDNTAIKQIISHNEKSIWFINGKLISPVQYIQYIFLTKDSINIFSYYYDFITEQYISKKTKKYYYKDVTNITKEDILKSHLISSKDIPTTKISLQVSSGDKIDFFIVNKYTFNELEDEIDNFNSEEIKKLKEKINIINQSDSSTEEKEYKTNKINKKINKLKNTNTQLNYVSDTEVNSIINNIRIQIDKYKKG